MAQLANYVNIERENGNKLRALLVEALRRLAGAREIELPPGWPDGDTPNVPGSRRLR